MAHQQRPAADWTEAAEVAAARQKLPAWWLVRHGLQAEALGFGHHHPAALRQQFQRAGDGAMLQALLAAFAPVQSDGT